MSRRTKRKHSAKIALKYRPKYPEADAVTTVRRQTSCKKQEKRKKQTGKHAQEQVQKRRKMNKADESDGNDGMWLNIIFHLVCVVLTMFISNNNHTIELFVALQVTLMMLNQSTYHKAPQDQSLQAKITIQLLTQSKKDQAQVAMMTIKKLKSSSHMARKQFARGSRWKKVLIVLLVIAACVPYCSAVNHSRKIGKRRKRYNKRARRKHKPSRHVMRGKRPVHLPPNWW